MGAMDSEWATDASQTPTTDRATRSCELACSVKTPVAASALIAALSDVCVVKSAARAQNRLGFTSLGSVS